MIATGVTRDLQGHRNLYVKSCYRYIARAKSRSLESANDAKTGEQSVFGEIHTNHELGTPKGTLQHRKLDSQTRYVAVSVVTDRQTDKPTTVTLAHVPRVKNPCYYL